MVKRMDNEGEDERRSHMSGREIVRGELQCFHPFGVKEKEGAGIARKGCFHLWEGANTHKHWRTFLSDMNI